VAKYVVEFIGTFFLVLTVGMTVLDPNGAKEMAPLAIGAALMVMIYAGGHISGAHYNPAVTLAVWIRGRCPARDVPFYWLAQVLGGLAAGYLVLALKHPTVKVLEPSLADAVLVEFLFTFALAYVVLNVATAKATAGNSHYGLAIGFTVVAGAYAVGAISGGAFNPAVAAGISAMGISPWQNIWIYLVGCLAGGAMAGFVFKALNPGDR